MKVIIQTQDKKLIIPKFCKISYRDILSADGSYITAGIVYYRPICDRQDQAALVLTDTLLCVFRLAIHHSALARVEGQPRQDQQERT